MPGCSSKMLCLTKVNMWEAKAHESAQAGCTFRLGECSTPSHAHSVLPLVRQVAPPRPPQRWRPLGHHSQASCLTRASEWSTSLGRAGCQSVNTTRRGFVPPRVQRPVYEPGAQGPTVLVQACLTWTEHETPMILLPPSAHPPDLSFCSPCRLYHLLGTPCYHLPAQCGARGS